MTFDAVKRLGEWMPIRDCPGRFVLHGVPQNLTLAGLSEEFSGAERFESSKARDAVWVVLLEDGGMISYSRPDGTWLHTLNTTDGFQRKLAQLEIALPEPAPDHAFYSIGDH